MGANDTMGILGALPSMITAARLGHPVQHEDVYQMPIEKFMIENVRRRGNVMTQEISEMSILARLDAGRWLADCPCGCGGAELVSEKHPLFVCGSCGSEWIWWPIIFPANRAEIDAEVAKRPDVQAWAWNPGETLIELKRETKRLLEAKK